MTRNLFEATHGLVSFGGAYVAHDPVELEFVADDGMTKQEFAEECDINSLMARYIKTGTMPQNPDRVPFYVDAFDLPSFQDAQNIFIEAEEAFMRLPAVVRREFDNDPAKFVAAADDAANTDRFREWGMLSPEAVERLDAAKAAEAAKAADRPGAAGKAAQGDSVPPDDGATQ